MNELTKINIADFKITDKSISEKIRDKIEHVVNNDLTEIELKYATKEALEYVFKISQLEKLRLSNGKFDTLPEGIGNLTNLTELRIDRCKIISIPESIGNCNKLIELELDDNKLTTLPKSIGKLKELKVLNVESNQLETLPKEIGQLDNLVELRLLYNNFQSLPNELGQLKKLIAIYAESNKFTEFPVALTAIESLQFINLNDNVIAQFPPEMKRMKKLIELTLECNELSSLPKELCELAEQGTLEHLNLEDNEFTKVSESFGRLKRLKILNLKDNPIENVPEEIIEEGNKSILTHLGLIEKKVYKDIIEYSDEERDATNARYEEKIDRFKQQSKDNYVFSSSLLTKIINFITAKTDIIPPVSGDDSDDFETISQILAPVDQWTFIDRRIIAFITQDGWCINQYNKYGQRFYDNGFFEMFYKSVAALIKQEFKNEKRDFFTLILAELKKYEIDDDKQIIVHCIKHLNDAILTAEKEPTSFGLYLLSKYSEHLELMLATTLSYLYRGNIVDLFIRNKTADFEKYLSKLLLDDDINNKETFHISFGSLKALCEFNEQKYESYLVSSLEKSGMCNSCRSRMMFLLKEYYGDKYNDKVLTIAQETLNAISTKGNKSERYYFKWNINLGDDDDVSLIVWLLNHFGLEIKEMIFAFANDINFLKIDIIEVIAKHFGQGGINVICSALSKAVTGNELAKYYRRLFLLLESFDYSKYYEDDFWIYRKGCQEIPAFDYSKCYEDAWSLAQCNYIKIREVVAKALSKLITKDDTIIEKATKLLAEKKAESRHGGAMVLINIDSPETKGILKQFVDQERSDDNRDVIINYLLKDTESLSKDDLLQRVSLAKQRGKLKKPVVSWLKEETLPALHWVDTKEKIDAEIIRFLFYRQMREKDIQPDVVVSYLYPLIDKESSGEFALEVLNRLLSKGGAKAKNRFALTIAGLLGDDKIVEPLKKETIKKMNLNTVETLGLLESDKALAALNTIRESFTTSYQNVHDAADEIIHRFADQRNITYYDLLDKFIPDLGFSGMSLPFKVKDKQYNAVINSDFKLAFIDDNNKTSTKLPSAATKDQKEAFKKVSKEIKSALKQQEQSLEHVLISQRRWAKSAWENAWFNHPLRFALAKTMVWGVYNEGILKESFIIKDDSKLENKQKGHFELVANDQIGLVHPLHLSQADRDYWFSHFVATMLKAAIPQLNRQIYTISEKDKSKRFSYLFDKKTTNATTFRYRAAKRGWRRGSVVDAGEVSAYRKSFSEKDIEVFLELENINVTKFDHEPEGTLKHLYFVKLGSVKIGRYVYDEPRDNADHRLLRLGDIPPIVYSEVMNDISEILKEK